MAGLTKEAQSGKSKKETPATSAVEKEPKKVIGKGPTAIPSAKEKAAKAPKVAAPATPQIGMEERYVPRKDIKVDYTSNGRSQSAKQITENLVKYPELPHALAHTGQTAPLYAVENAGGLHLVSGFRRITSYDLLAKGMFKEGEETLSWKNPQGSDKPLLWVKILPDKFNQRDLFLLELADNSHREWSGEARALAAKRLRDDFNLTEAQIAQKMGWSLPTVYGYLAVADNKKALADLRSDLIANNLAEGFAASVEKGSLMKKHLSETAVQVIAQAAEKVAVGVGKQVEKQQVEAGIDPKSTSAIAEREEKKAEAAEAAYVEMKEEAEASAPDEATIKVAVAKAAVSKIIAEKKAEGVEIKEVDRSKVKALKVDPMENLKNVLSEVRDNLKSSRPTAWMTPDPSVLEMEATSPYADVIESLFALIITGDVTAPALEKAIRDADSFYAPSSGSEGI